MIFSSHIFIFVFLPLLVVLYFAVPVRLRRVRNNLLLVFSLVFYGWQTPKYLIILVASILVNWVAGLMIGPERDRGKILRRIVLFFAIVVNCLILGYFKYTDFIIENLNNLLWGGKTQIELKHIVLPIGISFYTFQGLSYVIDVYRGEANHLRNPLRVALYIALFPQLVAGPIVRFQTIADQIENRHETLSAAADGAQRFILGLAKKILLADTFGIVANGAFDGTSLTVIGAWIGAIAYAFQIYFDFSGYSDMAIGLGKIFGFSFPENFRYPYIAGSVTDFWRRWHISLSSWFRDYVYIPLGGNRCSKIRHILNLLIVWGLTGLWHGASWNYVLWGLYYCAWLIIEKYVIDRVRNRIPKSIGILCTFIIVLFGWVLFRTENVQKATEYLAVMFGNGKGMGWMDIVRFGRNYWLFWIAGILGLTPLPGELVGVIEKKLPHTPFLIGKYVFLLLVFGLSVLYVVASSYNAFIYFQF